MYQRRECLLLSTISQIQLVCFCIATFAGCAGLYGTPVGGGLGFCFKLLLNAESFGNGFSGDLPLSLPSVLINKPS
ncbi:hypothetical protein [Polystyrenella longa]|uniref:hypothetical protein n=1 Tax=Polystyrenella longa TaxID=2528007 RepID=UPI00119E5367|nr:hypothetical protein [Polystyrenella longa]